MSGIVKNYESLIGGASGGNADTHTKGSGADIQIFTTTGSNRTWVKPSWVTMVYMEVIGAGGSGATGGSVSNGNGGGGGGGGAFTRQLFPAESVPATLTVVVGAGGTGGVTVSAQEDDGEPGAASSVTDTPFPAAPPPPPPAA